MTKSPRSRRSNEVPHTVEKAPSYMMKDALPPAWAKSRAAIDKKYSFAVREWYFVPLIALSVALFTASFFLNNLWLALIAALLAITLSQWNKRARKASSPTVSRRQ